MLNSDLSIKNLENRLKTTDVISMVYTKYFKQIGHIYFLSFSCLCTANKNQDTDIITDTGLNLSQIISLSCYSSKGMIDCRINKAGTIYIRPNDNTGDITTSSGITIHGMIIC